MSINPLSSNLINLLADERLSINNNVVTGSDSTFADILSQSLKTAADADTADKYSALQLLSGQSDDLSGLLIDMQKAELSLNLALQIRNKVIDAYNEIIRMSV